LDTVSISGSEKSDELYEENIDGISSSKVKKKFLAGKKKINSGENQIIAVNHHTFEM
jgi:hypothetical protein